MIAELLDEIQLRADERADDVLLGIMNKLFEIRKNPCKKHGELQARASIAAIRLWRLERKCFYSGRMPGEMEMYNAREQRAITSREYHAGECTCENRQKNRHNGLYPAIKMPWDGTTPQV